VNVDADAQTGFQSLEQLLALQTLVNTAQKMNELWCKCRKPTTEAMVLCNSTKCAYLWYHMECEGLSQVNSAQPSICSACLQNGNTIILSSYDDDDKDFEEGIVEASDKRIQRTKSLSHAWGKHKWPEASKVQELMYKTICCEIEIETRAHKFRDTVEGLEADRASSATQSRATTREDPLRMTRIKQRFRAAVLP
jgi:hypothetical protein